MSDARQTNRRALSAFSPRFNTSAPNGQLEDRDDNDTPAAHRLEPKGEKLDTLLSDPSCDKSSPLDQRLLRAALRRDSGEPWPQRVLSYRNTQPMPATHNSGQKAHRVVTDADSEASV